MQLQAEDLDFYNQQFEEENFSYIDPALRELIKLRAETDMLREQILQTVPALEDHYEVDLDTSSFMISNESKIAETGMTNWMDMTQESHG